MFILELPYDNQGNRRCTDEEPEIIEVAVIKVNHRFNIILPESYSRKLGNIKWAFLEVDGPAKKLTETEYVNILETLQVERTYLDSARTRERIRNNEGVKNAS